MVRQLFSLIGLFTFAALLSASVAQAATQTVVDPDAQKHEIEAKLTGIFNSYLAQFKPVLAQLQSQGGGSNAKLINVCTAPERQGTLADPKASAEEKLGAITVAADQFGAFASHLEGPEKLAQIVTLCRAVAPAIGHYWSGAVFAKLYSQLAGHRQEDLVAAYYGSGVLPATDFGLAKQALEETRDPHEENPQAIIDLIDDYEVGKPPVGKTPVGKTP